jgi:hypothetical protein
MSVRPRLLILAASFLLAGCASTQKMHFADFSSIDFSLPDRGAFLGMTGGIRRVTASGGDYTKVGEFADYSWHGFVDGTYEGFRRLPYPDPSRQVQAWIVDLLERNDVMVGSSPAASLDVFVRQLKLKTQKGFGYDYRACLVGLDLMVRDTKNAVVREAAVEGLAKLRGSDMTITDRRALSITVSFGPDEPPVCKLAIANALRAAPR